MLQRNEKDAPEPRAIEGLVTRLTIVKVFKFSLAYAKSPFQAAFVPDSG